MNLLRRTRDFGLALVLAAGGLAVAALPAHAAPAAPATVAASCDNYRSDSSIAFTFKGREFRGAAFFGYYSGNTVTPSGSQVTSSGLEAQCILWFTGFNPGAIDGVFGPNSRAAMADFQRFMNSHFASGLRVDGWPGPQSWKWLRWGAAQ
jgi:hypothetical protein